MDCPKGVECSGAMPRGMWPCRRPRTRALSGEANIRVEARLVQMLNLPTRTTLLPQFVIGNTEDTPLLLATGEGEEGQLVASEPVGPVFAGKAYTPKASQINQ